MVLSEPICRLLYEWGATVEEDTIGTAGIPIRLCLRSMRIFDP